MPVAVAQDQLLEPRRDRRRDLTDVLVVPRHDVVRERVQLGPAAIRPILRAGFSKRDNRVCHWPDGNLASVGGFRQRLVSAAAEVEAEARQHCGRAKVILHDVAERAIGQRNGRAF